jgi:lysophospholipase
MLDHLVPAPEGTTFPPGFACTLVETADGVRIRMAFARPEGARATILVLPGRAEFIEKYAEVLARLLERGFAVVMLDWRGQGGSQRQLRDPAKGHVEDFEDYLLDLEAAGDEMRRIGLPGPFGLLAHSTGGAVALLALARGESRFARAVLTAPLVGLPGAGGREWARILARTLSSIGLSTVFIPGGGRKTIFEKPFAGNPLTSDPERYARTARWIAAQPRLGIGDPTIGWVDAAFEAIAGFADPEFGRANRTPLLIMLAGADGVVDTRAAAALARRLKGAGAIELLGARHEILMENDRIQREFWAAFDAFMTIGREAEQDAGPAAAVPGD